MPPAPRSRACKILASQVLKSIALRAIQVHGALGLTDQLPLVNVLLGGIALGLADGPTEAHKVNLARMLLKGYEAEDAEWPSEMLDVRREAARAKYGDLSTRSGASRFAMSNESPRPSSARSTTASGRPPRRSNASWPPRCG